MRLWMVLALLVAPLAGAPAAPLDLVGLGRWLGGRLPEGPAEVALIGGGQLSATVHRVDGRLSRLADATLRWGPLTAAGELRVERIQQATVLEGRLTALRLGDLALGAGPVELSYEPRAGWSGQARLSGGVARDLRLRLAPAEAPCRRGPCPPTPLRLQIELEDLALGSALAALNADAAGLGGALSGQLHLGGPPADLRLEGSLTGPIHRGDEPLGELRVSLQRLADAPRLSLAAQLTGPLAETLRLRLELPWRLDLQALTATPRPGAAPLAASLILRGAPLAAWTAAAPALGLTGRLDAALVLEGPELSARADVEDLRWRGEAIGAVALAADLQAGIARGSLRWGPAVAPHASLGFALPLDLDPAAGDLRWRHRDPLRLGLRAQGLTPARLRPFWRAHPAADFSVDLQLDAEGPLAGLTGEARLTGQLADGERGALPLAAALSLRPQRQHLTASVGQALGLELTSRLPLLAVREGRARAADAPAEANLRLALPLRSLAPYLPGQIYDPLGTLSGAFSAQGPLGAPTFSGEAHLTDGALTVAAAHQRLTALKLSARAEGDTLHLSALEARSGVGRWQGAGQIRLEASPADGPAEAPLWSQATLSTTLELTAHQVPFQHALLPSGRADGQLALQATQRPGEAWVELSVRGGQITLTPVRLPAARAVPSHRRVAVMDWAGRPRGPAQLFAGDGRLRLTVRLVDPVAVAGDGVALALTGTLSLDRDPVRAEVSGGFEVEGGRFTLFEEPFRLRRGRISLQGGPLDLPPEAPETLDPDAPPAAVPLEPIFDWLAEGEVVGTYIDLALRGPARRPALILASDPPLPEYRILTLLVTGRVDAVDDRNGDVRRQVALLVERFHNPSLSRQLYDRLGVDKLGLQFKGLTQPVLTVGKQIDRRLYVETVYHHNAPPDANEKEGRAAYRLDPSWTVDTAYGDAAVGSVGVYWGRDFGGPPPARRAVRPLEGAKTATPEGPAGP